MEAKKERIHRIDSPVVSPFLVLIDDREQAPYSFAGLKAGADRRHRPLLIPTQTTRLATGDYSIAGLEDLVAVERKSLDDLYSTLGQGRARFEAEHERLASLEFAAVVIEAAWDEILSSPPWRSLLNPKAVHSTSIAWAMRYGVHWMAMGSRRGGEVATYRILEMFWRQRNKRIGAKTTTIT